MMSFELAQTQKRRKMQKMKKKILSMLLCGIMCISMFTGCGGSKESSEDQSKENVKTEVVKGGNMSFAIGGDLNSFNYSRCSGNDDSEMVLSSIYDALCSVTSDGVRYYLAESMEMPDATTLIVKLKDGLKWHDGEPITADDLVFTINYIMQNSGSCGTDILRVLVNMQPVTAEKVDNLTVKITAPAPQASMVYSIGEIHPLPQHIWADDTKTDEEKSALAVGSGPYKLKEYISGEKIVVERFDDYYREPGSLDTIEFKIIPDLNAREIAFESGDINFLRITDAQTLKKYKDSGDYRIFDKPEGRINFLALKSGGKLGEIKAREAVIKALNIPEIVAGVYGDSEFAVPANSMFSRLSYFYKDKNTNYEQDLDTAKKLAAETGLDKTTLVYAYNSSRDGMEETALMIQQQLKEAGIKVELKGMDAAGFFQAQAVNDGSVDMMMSGYASNGEEFHSRTFYMSYTAGAMGFEIPADVDAVWAETEATVDMDVRKQAADKVFEAAKNAYTIVPVSDTNYIAVMQNGYDGMDEYGLNTLFEDYTKLHAVK